MAGLAPSPDGSIRCGLSASEAPSTHDNTEHKHHQDLGCPRSHHRSDGPHCVRASRWCGRALRRPWPVPPRSRRSSRFHCPRPLDSTRIGLVVTGLAQTQQPLNPVGGQPGGPPIAPKPGGPLTPSDTTYKVDAIEFLLMPDQFVEYKFRLKTGADDGVQLESHGAG